jgi:LysM repeat protein
MRRVFSLLLVIHLGLTACASAATPQEVQPSPTAVEQAAIATPAPTVSVPTATPTEIQPPATPTATAPPPTATSIPTPTPQLYIVQEYDTLLGIAVEFATSIEALIAANGISEEDFLQIGQELVIPTELEEATPLPSTEPSNPTEDATFPTEAPAANTAALTQTDILTAAESAATDLPTAPAAPAAPPPSPTPIGPPLPTVSHAANINPLTGLPVDDPAKLLRRPLMVRIGNDVGARLSQIGFSSADMVYEEITEWWVTRFTAIFLAETPSAVGPVRSARLINVQVVPQYQGALAHSGGSDPVRWEISQAPIANLDEYYNPKPYFYRPNEGWQTRLALDAEAARDYMAAKGLEAPVALQGFVFSDSLDQGQAGENIFIPYPRATSFTQWSYDPASGQYLRWIDGAPLTDVSRGQVTASNVIIYFAEHQETDIVEDTNGATSIRILVNGKGPAWFFRDGKLNKGFWQTDGSRTPYFGYQDGRPYPLKPGNTWVEVVPTYFKIGLNGPDEASATP